jgi:hypothetical protein
MALYSLKTKQACLELITSTSGKRTPGIIVTFCIFRYFHLWYIWIWPLLIKDDFSILLFIRWRNLNEAIRHRAAFPIFKDKLQLLGPYTQEQSTSKVHAFLIVQVCSSDLQVVAILARCRSSLACPITKNTCA